MVFEAKNGEALYSQQNQDLDLDQDQIRPRPAAQIMCSLLKNPSLT